MAQGAIDRNKLQRLMTQGRALVDDLKVSLRTNQTPSYSWNDLTRWQASAVNFIKAADDTLVDEVTILSALFNPSEMFSALTSTMAALTALSASGPETSTPALSGRTVAAPGPEDTKALSKSVFIVHGHDNAMKQTVARFISALGLTPIVLHEQPNRGQTIIEKFEQNAAKAGFAVVLMSPDDIGASVAEPKVTRSRARQNVVMELGYFTGTLGRGRISVLISKDVEIPSDYMGVVYTPFDPGGAWKLTLANELQSAGYDIPVKGLLG